MNRRSPRVVSMPKIPLRGLPPGVSFSHIPIAISAVAMSRKNVAVGQVHAIQDKSNMVFFRGFGHIQTHIKITSNPT